LSLLNATQKDDGAGSVLGTPPVIPGGASLRIEIRGQWWGWHLPEVLESPSRGWDFPGKVPKFFLAPINVMVYT
jgi:hypothetical protein